MNEALTESLPLIEPGQQIGNFECVKIISRGGQASGVYLICPLMTSSWRRRWMRFELAFFGPSQRLVKKYKLGVLKIPKAKYRDHLLNERGFLSRPNMKHKHLAQLYNRRFEDTISREDRSGVMFVDVGDGQENTHRYQCLMLAYEPGGSLDDLMKDRKYQPLEPAQVVQIALQLTSVLNFLHTEHKLVYNDMAPANILLHEPLSSWRGTMPCVVLIDLAVADSLEHPRLEHIYGRARYMPPERLNRKKPAKMSPQVDIYGLGMVMYELLAGKFLNTSEIGETDRQLRPLKELNPSVSQELNDVVMTTLSNDVSHRKTTLPDMEALEQAIRNVPEARSSGTVRGPVNNRFYMQLATSLVSLLLIAFLTTSVLSVGATDGPTRPTASVPTAVIEETTETEEPVTPTAAASPTPTIVLPTSTRIPTATP